MNASSPGLQAVERFPVIFAGAHASRQDASLGKGALHRQNKKPKVELGFLK
jgi:hypothetical protein